MVQKSLLWIKFTHHNSNNPRLQPSIGRFHTHKKWFEARASQVKFRIQIPTTFKFAIFENFFNFGLFSNFTTVRPHLIFRRSAVFSEKVYPLYAAFLVRIIVEILSEKWWLTWQFCRFWHFLWRKNFWWNILMWWVHHINGCIHRDFCSLVSSQKKVMCSCGKSWFGPPNQNSNSVSKIFLAVWLTYDWTANIDFFIHNKLWFEDRNSSDN